MMNITCFVNAVWKMKFGQLFQAKTLCAISILLKIKLRLIMDIFYDFCLTYVLIFSRLFTVCVCVCVSLYVSEIYNFITTGSVMITVPLIASRGHSSPDYCLTITDSISHNPLLRLISHDYIQLLLICLLVSAYINLLHSVTLC